MLGPSQLLQELERHSPAPALASTGIPELDELTGGLVPGRLWLVTGSVGEGKTTLLTQLAVAIARRHHPVLLACPREPTAWVTMKLLAQLGVLPLGHLDGTQPPAADPARVQRARELLATLPISVITADSEPLIPETDPYGSDPTPTALLIDDADQIDGITPTRLTRWASDGLLTIATLPRDALLERPGDFAPLLPEWARGSDLVLEVRTRSLSAVPDALNPGQERPAELRPGEADLILHRHRWRPTRTVHAAFEGHYSRFTALVEG